MTQANNTQSHNVWDLLPEAYKTLVSEQPRHPLLLGYLRTTFDVAPSEEDSRTAAKLRKLLVGTIPKTVPKTTVTIRAEIHQDMSGTEYFTERRYFRGDLEVPFTVFEEGEEAVEDWIREQPLDWEYDNHESGDYVDFETEETELSTNFEGVVP